MPRITYRHATSFTYTEYYDPSLLVWRDWGIKYRRPGRNRFRYEVDDPNIRYVLVHFKCRNVIHVDTVYTTMLLFDPSVFAVQIDEHFAFLAFGYAQQKTVEDVRRTFLERLHDTITFKSFSVESVDDCARDAFDMVVGMVREAEYSRHSVGIPAYPKPIVAAA
jgi:hypothetical protein